jgi:hypothetical protein
MIAVILLRPRYELWKEGLANIGLPDLMQLSSAPAERQARRECSEPEVRLL